MIFKNLHYISDFSKLININFNYMINLFNNLLLLISKINILNCYYYFSLINVSWVLNKNKSLLIKNYLSRRFNLFYQRKFFGIHNQYIF